MGSALGGKACALRIAVAGGALIVAAIAGAVMLDLIRNRRPRARRRKVDSDPGFPFTGLTAFQRVS